MCKIHIDINESDKILYIKEADKYIILTVYHLPCMIITVNWINQNK
jgi:hypothetical protein